MTVTIEEVKAFIVDAKKAREDWLTVAKRSWSEIKKRQQDGKLWSLAPNSVKRRARYPLWNQIFNIRKPLLLSRVGIPIGRDTTQDGNDGLGAVAAICVERLAKNLSRGFDFFDVMCAARDDYLATNFGNVRAYYSCRHVKEPVKEYIQPQKNEATGDVEFVNGQGEVINSDEIYQDDQGYFVEHEEIVDVEDEEVFLEPEVYSSWLIDPDIRRWGRCRRLAFEISYSPREFEAIFGKDAFLTLPKDDEGDARINPGASDEARDKRQNIKVYEYWDDYEKDCYHLVENGSDFITPKEKMTGSEEAEEIPRNGIYDLEKFFPCPKPLLANQATDEFWPVPEFYQMFEIIEDIHNIFSRMFLVTRAVRARLLFDNSIEGLQEAVSEAAEGDAIGVDNLAQLLTNSGGKLDNAVQYLNIKGLVESLGILYEALNQRIQSAFQLTGTSDLLRGLTSEGSGKTLGERQLEEKYAVNQIAELQRKMAEFVRDCYQLLVEMALKNFKDESLHRYIMPQTLPKDMQPRYQAAIGMLRESPKRFRVELETDSTIALNEQYDKQMRIELVNALTVALEKTANIAQSSPALVQTELHALKFLVQGFRQGKLFQDEITAAIDNVIKMASEAPAPFNKDEMALKLKDAELQASFQLKEQKMLSDERIEFARLNQMAQVEAIRNELAQFKLQADSGAKMQQINFQYAELNTKIARAQEELAIKRDELLVEMRKVSDKKSMEEFALAMEQQFKPMEQQLEAYKLQLDQTELQLRSQDQALKAQEQQMVDAHVTTDNILQKMRLDLDAATLQHEATKQPELPPITINLPEPVSKKKKIKIERDELGNIVSLDAQDLQDPVK